VTNKKFKELKANYLKENNIEFDKKKQQYFTKKLNPDWPYKALYIDTINYNYWQRLYDELYNLRSYYESLPDETPKSDKDDPKQPDGKQYEPVCDKFFPLDYTKIFGIPITIPPPLFWVTVDLLEILDYLNPPSDEEDEEFDEEANAEFDEDASSKKVPFSIKDGYAYINTRNTNKITIYRYCVSSEHLY
jgi:hypothetical protein